MNATDHTLRITIDHVRAAGLCVNGSRAWFAHHGLDFRSFLREGLTAEALLATGDAMALRVVQYARAQQRMGRD